MTRTTVFLLTTLLASGCATPGVREAAHPIPLTAIQTPPPCHAPDQLVRDLTVPWSVRTYVIGPCPTRASPTASTAPASVGIEPSASEKSTP